MSLESDASHALDFDAYTKTNTRMLRRAKTLPKDKLEGLAREALRRLAGQSTKIQVEAIGPEKTELLHLCEALVGEDDTAAAKLIAAVHAEGVPAETVYLKYFAAAARELGEWWKQDRVGFWEVTVGIGRLMAIMHTMSHQFKPTVRYDHQSAVFASVPGEQHVLGLHMASDLFRKDGWDITVLSGLDHDQLVAEIERSNTRLIGLSMSGGHSLEALSKLVVALRICCPHARIIVSGQKIEEIRAKLLPMELDGIVGSIDDAKVQMAELWDNAVIS